ncbi:cell wall-binding repeat-containing protein [Metaclostridioides mangenotii]|uniref:cell wall-binding repeat-containing protein n=1 Tax=Metaclostridioides mangenotii TaxID=1540 RepID=UPI000464CBA3|nr:cell wall-binding repeat-containing protein [Clostridioides mangenotii]
MKVKQKLLALGLSFSIVIAAMPIVNALSSVDTIQGIDRYETAALIADKQEYTTAILVNSDKSLADGLSASGLAGVTDSPILLTQKDKIPNITKERLKKAEKVYIIGGTNSVSSKVESSLTTNGTKVKRISGSDRIKTSYNVASEIKTIKDIDKVVFTNAYKGEPDAMSISPIAARDGAPIILTDGKTTTFDAKNIESYVIGGSYSMSDSLVSSTKSTRIGGTDRFDTNKKIISQFYNSTGEFYITKSDVLVDALTGSTIAKETPIVLVNTMSDKTILNGATKLTSLGSLDKVTTQRCINATNPKDLYNEEVFNSELQSIMDYNNSMAIEVLKDEAKAVAYANASKPVLQNLYEEHLMINSDSTKYNKMTQLISQVINLNNAVSNKDYKSAITLSQQVVNTLAEIEKLKMSI